MYIVDAGAVQLIFHLATKVGTFQGFRQKMTPQGLVFQVLPNIRKALLAVFQHVDDLFQD
jgi:hypothetical protein